jgi:hypothetical protein
MILRQLLHSSIARKVNSRIADVSHQKTLLREKKGGHRAAHPQLVSLDTRPFEHSPIRVAKCLPHAPLGIGRFQVVEIGEIPADHLNGHLARNLARGVPAHSIRDDEKAAIRIGGSVKRILVTLANSADISASRNGEVH